MVVVDREHPAEVIDGLLVRPAHDDRSVAPLRREHLHVADDGAQDAVAPAPRRVGGTARGELE